MMKSLRIRTMLWSEYYTPVHIYCSSHEEDDSADMAKLEAGANFTSKILMV